MKALTAPQIKELANDLDRINVAIGILRQNGKLGNGDVLTKLQQDDLLIAQIKLFRSSALFSSQAINLNGDSIRQQLIELKAATTSIDSRLAKMESVDQVLDLSGLVLSVAAAVATGDVVTVTASLNSLLETISSIKS